MPATPAQPAAAGTRPRRVLLWGGLALAAGIVAYVIAQSSAPRIGFDLTDARVAQLWLSAATGARTTPEGIAVGDAACLLASPEPGDEHEPLEHTPWRDARFVTIELAPAPAARNVALVWIHGGSAPVQRMLASIPAGASRVVVDTQRRRPWLGGSGWVARFPADGVVWRVGIALRSEAMVRRITLQRVPSPRDLVTLMWDDLTTIEPVLASSINFHYGTSVLGVPLSVAFGLVVALLGIVALARRRAATSQFFFAGSLVLLVLFDLTVFHGLTAQVSESHAVSAWHASRYDEYRSRFGEAFARLDGMIRQHVPRGTAVALPDPPSTASPRNTNWLWFLYQGEYANHDDRARDNATIAPEARYVVFDQPRLWAYAPATGIMRHRVTGATVAVAPVAAVSDSVLLLRIVR